MSKWWRQPMTYFIYALGAKAIKIGFTKDLRDRLDTLSTASPFELLPVAAIFGGMSEEARAHKSLAAHRIRGEWFDDDPAVWDYIEAKADTLCENEWTQEASSLVRPKRLRRSHESVAEQRESGHRALAARHIRDAFNRASINGIQRRVLTLRFGLDEDLPEMTLEQAAGILGITHQRVGQIERTALEALSRNRELESWASI